MWNEEQGEWLDPNGTPATGLNEAKSHEDKSTKISLDKNLNQVALMQRAKDYISVVKHQV